MMLTAVSSPESKDEIAKAIQRLRAEHRALEERLACLDQHLALTPEEELEVRTIKKLKLRKKDMIRLLEYQTVGVC